MPHLSLALLGPPRISVADSDVADFGYTKVRALLIYLAVERGRAHNREALAELLWPDQPPQVSRSSLRQALARLRQALGERNAAMPLFLVDRTTVRINPARDLALDIDTFAALVADMPRHGHTPSETCPACIAGWTRAVELYGGPFADGATPRDAQGFEEWVNLRRGWFEARQIETLARLSAHAEAGGDFAQVLDYARRVLAIDPLREPAHRAIMRALAQGGERATALAQYERCRRTLADELGIEPEAETEALRQAISAGEISPSFTPAASAPPEPMPVTNLPAQPTSFIGRAADMRDLAALLDNPERRLITLLGPGGIGKTRLAHRLAERAAPRYRHGVSWVPLAPLSATHELAGALARALGCAHNDSDDLRARLCEHLRPRELLLVLDNFEHILDGADLLAELLAAAPHLTLVVTSRERLHLQAEWVYKMGGLLHSRLAPAGESAEAVQLLLERARQVTRIDPLAPAELVAATRIAGMVEGLPLALELAAATRHGRTFAMIASTLDRDIDLLRSPMRDVPERHRSLRATIEHSWRLLRPAGRTSMMRLSLFRSGFTPEAAHAVSGADKARLDDLVDTSLLRHVGDRFDMHELVRRYAAEALAASGDLLAAEAAYLAWCQDLAAEAEAGMVSPEQDRWIERLEAEHVNLRAGITWAIDRGQAVAAQRLAAPLLRFWWMSGRMVEGRSWLEQSLALGGDDPAARARALNAAGGMAIQLGDSGKARPLLEESLTLERVVGRQAELSRVLNNLAMVYTNQGEHDAAQGLIEEALETDRALGDERGVAYGLGVLGQIAYIKKDYERATALYTESLTMHRRVGDQHSIGISLINLGAILFMQDRFAEARSIFEEGLALFRVMKATFGEAFCLPRLARTAFKEGDLASSRAYGREALPILANLGNTNELATCLVTLAQVAMANGAVARAARIWGATDRLVATITDLTFDLEGHQSMLADARAQADPALWEPAWAAGQALSAAEIIAEIQQA